MANRRYFHTTCTRVTGAINRAKQLVQRQFEFIEEHPQLAPKNFRRLGQIARQLEEFSMYHPEQVDTQELHWLLDDLAFVVENLQRAA